MRRIVSEAALGRYDRALALADAYPQRDQQVSNAKGVCLMRLGRSREAVALYRSLLVTPDCTSVRADCPAYLKLNYATALLLAGQPGACLDVLQQAGDRWTIARALRGAVERWETTLPFSQKLDWWINHVAPPGTTVATDFTPGDFGPLPSADAQCANPLLPAQQPVLPAQQPVLPAQQPVPAHQSLQSSGNG